MTRIIKIAAALLISVLICSSFILEEEKEQTTTTTEKPNIIFLLTDDQRFDALGCMGNSEIQTPNIDNLASQGTLFLNHYNPTAICMGARAVIMTGMYEHKTGCNFSHGPLTKEKFSKSYPVLLRDAGYYTGFTGKFGYAVTESAEEPSNYKTNDKMPMAEFDWWRGWPDQGSYNTAENEFMVEYATEYPHVSTALGAASVDFIQEAKASNKPFCLSVSFKAPHNPVSPDPQFDNVYAGKQFTQPENYWMEGAKHLPVQAKLGRQYQDLSDTYNPEKYHESLAKYYQLIYGIDVAVGMILTELENQGLMDNTIIIFTTDNGYFCGSHAMGGKVLPYEEGSRAPLIIYDPYSTQKGVSSNALTGNQDMAPTILDYAGLPIPENMDGYSLAPIVKGQQESVKEHQILTQAWGVNSTHALSVLYDDYKYIYWFYGGHDLVPAEELYNLKEDPEEMSNLAEDDSYALVLDTLRTLYDQYVEQWKLECTQVVKNNYIEYGILFNRNIPWEDKVGLMNHKKEPDSLAVIDLINSDIDTIITDTTTTDTITTDTTTTDTVTVDSSVVFLHTPVEAVAVNIYPNPTTDEINIELEHYTTTDLHLELFALNGRRISTLFNGKLKGKFRKTFSLNQPPGIYTLRIGLGLNSTSKLIYIR